MNLPTFQYLKLGDFAYHILTDPEEIKPNLDLWILREWELDHSLSPHEHWPVEWMEVFPQMEFKLVILRLEQIYPHPDLWSVESFQAELRERADEREWAVLRGVSIEPLLVNHNGLQLMDGYTRYTVLKRYNQKDVYVYVGQTHRQAAS